MENATRKEKKLAVKDLKISFRTQNGKVQAVRNISFDLYRGETLAIVGESGSGKSVTSRAIMGILAPNAIVEGGEILYDGKDLLKISEKQFQTVRGDKIAMVFQDPLSSLNPIMKIGKQLTEAMLLKNRASRRESRADLNRMFREIAEQTIAAAGDQADSVRADLARKIADFKKFEFNHIRLEKEFNEARDHARVAAEAADDLMLEIEKNAVANLGEQIAEISVSALHSFHRFVVREQEEAVRQAALAIRRDAAVYRKTGEKETILANLTLLRDAMNAALAKPEPNFFGLGYYLTFVTDTIPEIPVEELNALTHEKLDSEFMLNFIATVRAGVEHAAKAAQTARLAARDLLAAHRGIFEDPASTAADMLPVAKELIAAVEAGINPVSVHPDSFAMTFGQALENSIRDFSGAIRKNEAEKVRFEKQRAKWQKIVDAGKTPSWEVVPADYLDLDDLREQLLDQIDAMAEHLTHQIDAYAAKDYTALTVGLIDYFKEKASGTVNRLSRKGAKRFAIQLMEDVGIPEPRKRFRQYPFEFSGGMRQRIVIAIALTANPDILICDEPTTALDVTIQAQILELINKLKAERNLSIIFITHDLGVVANMADRIAVMYAGKIVEYGTAEDVFYSPAHPYTWALLSSVPDLDTNERLESIPGTPPNMIYPPKGDAFAERNKYAMQIDFEQQPPMFRITDTHYAATWLLHPNAPKLEPPAIITDRIRRMREKGGKTE